MNQNTPHSIFNDDIDTPNDILHRGTRQNGTAPVDGNGLPKIPFDESGKPLAAENGSICPSEPAEIDKPPAQAESAEEEAAAARLEIVRQFVGWLALGQTNKEALGLRTALVCNILFPYPSQAEFARAFGISEGSVSGKLNAAKRDFAAFLRASVAPTSKIGEGSV
jgi:hypothetical protein